MTVRKQTSAKPLETPSSTPLPTPVDEQPRRRRATSDAAEEDFGGAPSTLEVARQLYADEGLAAFWSGFPEAALLSINPSITMYLLAVRPRLFVLADVLAVQARAAAESASGEADIDRGLCDLVSGVVARRQRLLPSHSRQSSTAIWPLPLRQHPRSHALDRPAQRRARFVRRLAVACVDPLRRR